MSSTDFQRRQDHLRYDSASNISYSNGDICRICHCEADIDNPLLSPCYCSGSLKYVHQSCLRQWLAASDTRSCELCKFNFILQTKIKPLSEWRTLDMSSVERRRLLCAILFHFVAAVCVIWSLFVLIDRAAEEVQKGLIAWPFWTKLVVVAVGFTGGAVFMYIQCRQYLHLFARWKAHNRIILVQNAPEKNLLSSSPPSLIYSKTQPYSPQVHAHHATFSINLPPSNSDSNNESSHCYVFEKEDLHKSDFLDRSCSSSHKDDIHVEDICDDASNFSNPLVSTISSLSEKNNNKGNDTLRLDMQCSSRSANDFSVNQAKTEVVRNKSCVFKSLPNLNSNNFIV